MNKNKRIVIICGLLICLTAIGGFLYGKEQRRQQIKDLPVIENMATYPAYTLAQLTDEATYIVEATVSRVKDSKMEKVDAYYIDESGKKVDCPSYFPITPVVLEVKQVIKGEMISKRMTYYEEGGATETHIELPPGIAMREGMELIFFLNEKGYGLGGGQGLFPVYGDKVKVTNVLTEYLEGPMVTTMRSDEIEPEVWNLESNQDLYVMGKEDFISDVRDLMK